MTNIRLVVFDMAGTTVKDNDNVHAALMHMVWLPVDMMSCVRRRCHGLP